MHGRGILTLSGGNSYEGKWENGKYLNINGDNVNEFKKDLLDTMD